MAVRPVLVTRCIMSISVRLRRLEMDTYVVTLLANGLDSC